MKVLPHEGPGQGRTGCVHSEILGGGGQAEAQERPTKREEETAPNKREEETEKVRQSSTLFCSRCWEYPSVTVHKGSILC